MSPTRPPGIDRVLIAAADLEDAGLERDRQAVACGEAIRQALAGRSTPAQIALAAGLSGSEVRRLAGQRVGGPEGVGSSAASEKLKAIRAMVRTRTERRAATSTPEPSL